jgi:hypothetical protein
MSITIEQAQEQVDEWINTIGVRYFNGRSWRSGKDHGKKIR